MTCSKKIVLAFPQAVRRNASRRSNEHPAVTNTGNTLTKHYLYPKPVKDTEGQGLALVPVPASDTSLCSTVSLEQIDRSGALHYNTRPRTALMLGRLTQVSLGTCLIIRT
jgi:hypothetical protein